MLAVIKSKKQLSEGNLKKGDLSRFLHWPPYSYRVLEKYWNATATDVCNSPFLITWHAQKSPIPECWPFLWSWSLGRYMDHQRLASQNLLSRMNSTEKKCLDIKFSDNFPYSFLHHPMTKLQTKAIKLDLRLLLKAFISEFKFRTKPGLS